ncbi:hypothetical protein [Paenibacillus herberti]|uniref:Uncharacterized protein n=1 Tax=Paenibacillus herberti TaxID=1619309 RepID=A0A229NV04_9BACL|nr:hypothetical protein CGZ75_22225 [Paenibacillus herberti]
MKEEEIRRKLEQELDNRHMLASSRDEQSLEALDVEMSTELDGSLQQGGAQSDTDAGVGHTNDHGGRVDYEMDIDRMVGEGLGGGQVTIHNGHIGESTTDTMKLEEDIGLPVVPEKDPSKELGRIKGQLMAD